MKNKKIVTAVLLMAVPALLAAAGCTEKIEPGNTTGAAPKTIKAATAVAQVSTQPFYYEAVGTVSAQTASTLSGQIMGTVRAVNVKEGDSVSQGDVLVVLDERQVEAGLQRTEAGLAESRKALTAAQSARDSAQAGAQLAETTFKRYQRLFEQESVTRQEFDEVQAKERQAKASLDQAEAMVAAARSRVRQAQAAVSGAAISRRDARVLAPYDGIVTARHVHVGDLASPGTPLVSLEKSGAFQADLVLPEHHLQSVRAGQTMPVTIPALDGTQGSVAVEGIVKNIVPTADQRSRSFTVKVILPSDDRIRSGMFVRVSIPVGEGGMLLIPSSATVVQGQLTGFFMVDDASIAHFRLIRTGRSFGDQVEIISGLKPGTRYVTAPTEELMNGMKITEAGA